MNACEGNMTILGTIGEDYKNNTSNIEILKCWVSRSFYSKTSYYNIMTTFRGAWICYTKKSVDISYLILSKGFVTLI